MEKYLFELIKSEGATLEEAQVFGDAGIEYWHSSVLNSNRSPISGGFSEDRMQARKIAVAEFLERKAFRNLSESDVATQAAWGLNLIPTACGFAAGFDRENTVLRSIKEATERWVMSKWIDEQCQIEEIPFSDLKTELDSISLFFVSQFEKVLFFKKTVVVPVNNQFLQITVAQTMGLTELGIFPGSSAQYTTSGNVWQHALLESFRHLLAVRNNPDRGPRFPDEKVKYFANNKTLALNQIYSAKNIDWPSPQICIHKEESQMNGFYFIARTIMSGWDSWHLGPLDRFLY
jgi:hypothetical protein